MCVVLIVEDEVPVRHVAETILRRAGHETLCAGTVSEALAIIQSMQSIDLLFTDMALGNEAQGGIRVSEGVTRSRPGLPVLYTSGGVIADSTRSSFVEPGTFLPKPYSRAQLLQAVSDLTRAAH
jgi:two-component system cell cycle sensor histidine kinase/response regulator CckA